MAKEYEIAEHTADLKLYAFGATLEELFKNALKGMFSSIKPQGRALSYKNDVPVIRSFEVERHITIHSQETEELLIDFLSECLYLSDIHNEAYFDVRFSFFSPPELEGTLFGVKISGFEVAEIKAVTYHDLVIENVEGIWQATLVFDV